MKVNKSSWHYRWMRKIGFSVPTNLCPYFWKVIWSGLVFPVVAVVATIGTIFLTMPIWGLFVDIHAIQILGFVIGSIEIALLICALCVQLKERWEYERYQEHGYYGKPRSKANSLFRAWMKARHDQVCPILEFVDDDS